MKVLAIPALTVTAIFVAPSLASATSLSYPDFSSTSGMTLLSSATIASNELQLTSNAQNQFGQAWFNTLQNVAGGFTANFTYQMTGGAPGFGLGDGFAFVIQNDPNGSNAVGSTAGGGSIGYSFWPFFGGGLSNGLAIEFNSNDHALYIQSCGTGVLYSHQFQGVASQNCTLTAVGTGLFNDGNVHTVQVDYTNAGLLSVGFDGQAPLVSTSFNLSSGLNLNGGDSAFVGFTAGSGGDAEFADILNFDFQSTDAPEPSSFLLLGAALVAGVAFRIRRKAV
jgi:hypothetical protein